MLMDFGGVFGLRPGRKHQGRPTRYVRRQTIIGLSPFTYLPCCLLMSKTCYHSFNNPWHRLPRCQKPTVSITYGVDCHVVVEPRRRTATLLMSHGVNCHTITVPRTLQPSLCTPIPIYMTSLTLQACTAVSIDTRTALVRFTGRSSMVHIPLVPTCTCIPTKPTKPLPQPAGTCTLVGGYGFVQVRVWVALEYPRVTCDNLYI